MNAFKSSQKCQKKAKKCYNVKNCHIWSLCAPPNDDRLRFGTGLVRFFGARGRPIFLRRAAAAVSSILSRRAASLNEGVDKSDASEIN